MLRIDSSWRRTRVSEIDAPHDSHASEGLSSSNLGPPAVVSPRSLTTPSGSEQWPAGAISRSSCGLVRQRGARATGADAPPSRFVDAVIAAGGTGGHIFPGLALADALRRARPDIGITFVGTKRGLEKT